MTEQPTSKSRTPDTGLTIRAASDPKARSILDPAEYTYLRRVLPTFQTPILEADRWRRTVQQQPVAGLCKTRLITYLQAASWSIEAKDPAEGKKYQGDIDYYTQVVDNDMFDFDQIMDLVWQDAFDLPVGGNVEVVRYKPGQKPPGVKGDNPKGHVFSLEFIDGGTIYPTGDRKLPIVQVVPGYNPVYFTPNEIARILMSPRPEWNLRGYGMAPPERIFLAIMMLYYGDQYYAKLLLDTPEAGILYLGDMERDAAIEWLSGFRELFSGINPMKIPVIYETQTPPQFINFGRPPSEMTYSESMRQYVRIVTAGYNLKPGDVGLEDGQETLAGKIRDDRQARSTGYGVVITKTENFVNRHILPPYLRFQLELNDEEATIQLMRARLMAGQAAKALEDAGIATAEELQAQYQMEGLFTVEMKKPEKPETPAADDGTKSDTPDEMDEDEQIQNELDRKPAAEGGRGDSPGIKNGKGYTEKAMVLRAINDDLARIADLGGYMVDQTRWINEKTEFWAGEPSDYDAWTEIRDAFIESLIGIGYTDQQARTILARMEYELVSGSERSNDIAALLFNVREG